MKLATKMTDRAKAFLNQFENPSQSPDPRSFGEPLRGQGYFVCPAYSTSHVVNGVEGDIRCHFFFTLEHGKPL